MRKIISIIAVVVLTIAVASGCAKSRDVESESNEQKILRVSESFTIGSLNPHLDYQGWYTSKYGLTEALFGMNDESAVVPVLAESAEITDNTWTIRIKDAASFSNGTPVNSEVVIRNLKVAGETNKRFAQFAQYDYEVLDDKTFKITTQEVYPTLLNDLASPELAIVDLDNSGDMRETLVATGPFTIAEFTPEGTVKVSKNAQYWNGEVKLDGAEFYYMPEPDTALLAMQNGEIDAYTSVPANANEIYAQNPDQYHLTTVPATRLQFYILNVNRLSETVRKAINLSVDLQSIEAFLSGTITRTVGPFASTTRYGKATKDEVNAEGAKALLETDGYVLNADGYYEKNGVVLTINIAYYTARSLDIIATLMQEQLNAIGIDAKMTLEEDPDGTYIETGDFDIALYSMIADKSGDPYDFINATIAEGAPYNSGGFSNAQVQSKIDELKVETDVEKRAELANSIVQTVIDEAAFGYAALFNKTTVMRTGISNVFENSPFDFYFLNAETDIR